MKQVIRAGGYAVSSIGARPWINMPVEQKREKNGRMCKQVPIVHPIFKECAGLTNDPMWQSIFNNASIGKFPKGFNYKDGRLTSRGKSKNKVINISDDPLEVLYLCIEFFKLTAGLTSERDQARNKQEYDSAYEKTNETFESCIKSRKVYREECIRDYLNKLGSQHNLDQDKVYQLICRVELGFFLNRLDYKKDLIIDESKKLIVGIHGLAFDENDKEFFIKEDHPVKLTPRPSKKKIPREGIIDVRWRKFLEDLDKKKKKTTFQNSLLASPHVSRQRSMASLQSNSPN